MLPNSTPLRNALNSTTDEQSLFEVLYNCAKPYAIAIARSYIQKRDTVIEVKDVLQDLSLKILQTGTQYFIGKSPEHVESLLRQMARQVCEDRRKSRGRYFEANDGLDLHPSLNDREGRDNLSVQFETSDLTDKVLAGLSVIQRTVLALYIDGYELKEIADELGMKLSNVKYHCYEAQRKARRMALALN